MNVVLGEIFKQNSGWRGSPELWMDAAYEVLVSSGVDNVRIVSLAKKLKLSRTSFYWFFKDRDELLATLLQKWRDRNSQGLQICTSQPASTICEAVLNVSYLWMDRKAFDCEFEFAVRSWGLSSKTVEQTIQQTDEVRLGFLKSMFLRFSFDEQQADIRARSLYQAQIGYISMRLHLQESLEERIMRIVHYAHVFAGQKPTCQDIDNFCRAHDSDEVAKMVDFLL